MTTQTGLFAPFPPDAQSLWNMNGDYAGKAYQAWFETAGRIQGDAMQFLRNRFEKDVATFASLGKCKTPVEAFNIQFDYARDAFADFVGEGQKFACMLGEVARENLPGATLAVTSSEPKRTLRRTASNAGH